MEILYKEEVGSSNIVAFHFQFASDGSTLPNWINGILVRFSAYKYDKSYGYYNVIYYPKYIELDEFFERHNDMKYYKDFMMELKLGE